MAQALHTKKEFEVLGVPELQTRIRDLVEGLGGEPPGSTGRKSALTKRAYQMLGSVLREAATLIRDETKRRAISLRWPRSALEGIFAYFDPNVPRRHTTSLVGVSKRPSMVEWRAGKHPKSPKARVPPGGWVAMSRAAMYEYGTTAMRARPAFRPAVAVMKGMVGQHLMGGLKQVIESFNWSHETPK